MKYLLYVPRKVELLDKISEEKIKKDLEKYVNLALSLGATKAKAVSVKENILPFIDERVRAKCLIPRCNLYGRNASCPPRAPSTEEVRRIIARYRYAVVMKMDVHPEDYAGVRASVEMKIVPPLYKAGEIVNKVEATAFYDGYYFAIGFVSGSCQIYLCQLRKCTAIDPGGECRWPLRPRPSMEAWSMDAFAIATNLGWEMYPVGVYADPKKVPCASNIMAVFVT